MSFNVMVHYAAKANVNYACPDFPDVEDEVHIKDPNKGEFWIEAGVIDVIQVAPVGTTPAPNPLATLYEVSLTKFVNGIQHTFQCLTAPVNQGPWKVFSPVDGSTWYFNRSIFDTAKVSA